MSTELLFLTIWHIADPFKPLTIFHGHVTSLDVEPDSSCCGGFLHDHFLLTFLHVNLEQELRAGSVPFGPKLNRAGLLGGDGAQVS